MECEKASSAKCYVSSDFNGGRANTDEMVVRKVKWLLEDYWKGKNACFYCEEKEPEKNCLLRRFRE